MKKIVLMLLMLAAITANAQSWSNWVTLNNNKGVSASISFLIRGPHNGSGISYFQTNNNTAIKDGILFFAFDYVDADGKQRTQTGEINLSKTGADKDPGSWFISNGGSVTNIRVTRIDLPSGATTNNGLYNPNGNNNGGLLYGNSNNHQNAGNNTTGTSSSNSASSNMQNQIDPDNFYNTGITPLSGQSSGTTNTGNNSGSNTTNSTTASGNNTGQANIRIIPNKPLNLNSPAANSNTNSNTRNLAQDMQGLQQTQNYLNQQQAQLQQTTTAVDNAIQGIGNIFLQRQQQKQAQQAKIEEERAEDRTSSLNAFGQMMYLKEAAAEKLSDYDWKSLGDISDYEWKSLGDSYSGVIHKYKDYTENYPKAIEYYQRAADNGNRDAMLQLYYIYGSRMNNPELAKEWFQKYTADTSDAKAICQLGYAYEYGFNGYAKNTENAIMCYAKAADNGDADAMLKLYFFYHNNKNKDEAIKWGQQFVAQLQNNADTGDIHAMDMLSRTYDGQYGKIVKKDKFKSREWWWKYNQAEKAKREHEKYNIEHNIQQAADNGDVHAMFKLGEYYEAHDDNIYVGKEYSKAKYWYQKAAQAAGNN